MNPKKGYAVSLILFSAIFFLTGLSRADELADIQKGIKDKGAKWVAGKTSMMMLLPEERKKRLGLDFKKELAALPASPYQESFTTVPATFDWRNIDGNGKSYVTPVRNQSSCGSCWAFAAAAGLESYTLMTQNTPNTNLDLAEQLLLSCYNTNGCSGGSPSGASYYIQSVGLPAEACFPYTAFDAQDGANSVLCGQACINWSTSTYRILNYGSVSATTSAIKDALVNYGPLVTTFSVYADFFSYHGGIYSYTSGAYQGGHAVLIVGYDDVNQCFIVKNSWGTGWGESGFFRIAYSQLASPVYFGSGTLTYYASLSAPTITVTKPAGGDTWPLGSTQVITWSFTGNPGSSVKIDLLKGGVYNQTISNSASIASSYNWSVPSGLTEGSDYAVFVTSTSNASISGTSGTFSIIAPLPLVTFSAGGTASNKTGGLSGVIMKFNRISGTGTVPGTVKTGTNGIFSQSGFTVGTMYKVTPSKTGYTFTPASVTFTNGDTSLNFLGTAKSKR
jgi:hypothetical protein